MIVAFGHDSADATNNFNKQKQFEIMDEYSLLGIMSAIIYSNLPQSSKDNGYGIINAVGQAHELLNELNKQT